jgi:hypothetical protein
MLTIASLIGLGRSVLPSHAFSGMPRKTTDFDLPRDARHQPITLPARSEYAENSSGLAK